MKRNKDGMLVHESFKKISIELYEEICNKCKGHGWFYNEWLQRITCPRCKGLGKTSWIDNIKKRNEE